MRDRLRRLIGAASCFVALAVVPAGAQERVDPYTAEGSAENAAKSMSLAELRAAAATFAENIKTALDACTAAEMFKRLGDPRAADLYERCVQLGPDEPAYELFAGRYYWLYRGAGSRPLFPAAERHLLAAAEKWEKLRQDPSKLRDWDKETSGRLQRSLAALYERDGIQLASRETAGSTADVKTSHPWLFLQPAILMQQSTTGALGRPDIQDSTSSALFSATPQRVGRPLIPSELEPMARGIPLTDAGVLLRARTGPGPSVDVAFNGRRAADAQTTRFDRPGLFHDVGITSIGGRIEQPFSVAGSVDALISAGISTTSRRGLIDPEPAGQQDRSRTMGGGSVMYQLFRPLTGHTSGDPRFELRGIDLLAGIWNDDEHFGDVTIKRQDRYLGVAFRGLGRIDLALRPTWYFSDVTGDPNQSNSQLRLAGTMLVRLLDEERTATLPAERLFGMNLASVHLVVPIHWDFPRTGLDVFRSRSASVELWAKLFSHRATGVTALVGGGVGRQWFPAFAKPVTLTNARLSIGF